MQNTENSTENSSLIESLFSLGAHFGYSRSRRHPSVKDFIFGSKNRVDIIDLEQTIKSLNTALEFVASLAKEGKTILFVGNKYEARKIIKDAADSLDMPYCAERWIGGTFTNFSEIQKRVARLEDILQKKETGGLDVYTKKERGLIDKELSDLEKRFSGIVSMKKLPNALLVIDSKEEDSAVREARQLGIPVISLSASDCDISLIDYPIVANDSSAESIKFFLDKIVEAYQTSKRPTISPISLSENETNKSEAPQSSQDL